MMTINEMLVTSLSELIKVKWPDIVLTTFTYGINNSAGLQLRINTSEHTCAYNYIHIYVDDEVSIASDDTYGPANTISLEDPLLGDKIVAFIDILRECEDYKPYTGEEPIDLEGYINDRIGDK